MKSIYFITKSERFDSLINSFRRSGVDAHKGNASTDFDKFDVLIIDLGYPLEMAYPILERIKGDYNFSEKIVIASITHRSQLVKLRSFALGCDDYISPSIEYKDIFNKIQELQNPGKYLVKKVFSDEQTEIIFDGSLTHISESGCLIKSKVSIDNEEEKLLLKSKLLDDLKLSSAVQLFISKSNPLAKRSFITEIYFANMTEEDRSKIRKMVLNWSTT